MAAAAPKVSVIIPAYNVTAYIADALESLRAQTFRNFETIVVNDGCPDTENLEQVLQPYRSEIVYLKKENGGVSSARNMALRASRGELIALLDPDDIWEPEYLEVQTGILASRPDLDLIYPDAVFFGDTPWEGRTIMEMFPSSGEITFQKLAALECRVFVGVTVRREPLFRANLFDTNLPAAEDFDLWLRLARMGAKLDFHTRKLVRYRSRQGSLSHDSVSLARSVLHVYRKFLQMPDLTADEKKLLKRLEREQQAELDFYVGRKALYAGRHKEAREALGRANVVKRNKKVSVLLIALQLTPSLVDRLIHRKFPTESAFMH